MENHNRISILLSSELAFILENLSNLTGQTKTSIIQSALVDKIPDYIAECIYLICINMGYKSSFSMPLSVARIFHCGYSRQ